MDNLTVVIPFYRGHAWLEALLATIPADLPVIVVDDGVSEGDAPPDIGGRANVRVLSPAHKGYFAGAVNAGLMACSTDVLVLNQDSLLRGDAWRTLLATERGRYAMIGERIKGDHPAFPHGYIHGTFMFLRRDALDAVGLLNARDYPLWGNTAEWSWRAARRGFEILPLATVPDFEHRRESGQAYGSSIRELVASQPKSKTHLIQTPPLVSVIVPCFNYGRYLEDCIHSLIGGPTSLGQQPGQTLQSFEVILVDDASTDGSDTLVRGFADGWQGIRALCLSRNRGTAGALNAGIETAVGQYITFLSADDMRAPGSLEALVRACQANPHHFAYDDVQMFGRGRLLRTWRMEEYDFDMLLLKNHVHAGILYPRQAWIDAGGYPPEFGNGREDWAFNVALGRKGWCGVHVKQFGYLYRREGQNRSLTNSTPEHRTGYLGKLQARFPDLYRGERPMACCGGKRTSTVRSNGGQQPMASANLMTGSEGMILLSYEGDQQLATWPGPVTNTNYRFGAGRRKGWVDKRDAGRRPGEGDPGAGMLAMRRNGKYLFAVSTPKAEPEPAPEAVAAAVSAAAAMPAVQAQAGSLAGATAEKAIDPGQLTVAEIKLLQLTPAEWKALFEAEHAGKARASVLAHAESKAGA